MPARDDITSHYATRDIAALVLAALRAEHGQDVAVTPATLAPIDHFHGRGLAATKELFALLKPQKGEHLLDMGSGIGGPARWIAAHAGCRVSGIDLTADFCTAATVLAEATGQSTAVDFRQGSATELPFAAGAFDRVYSQNVIMNIEDKAAFYAQALRVLKPGGTAAFSNLASGPNGDPYYPTPWASTAATSFLSTPAETERDLKAVGFEIVSFQEATAEALKAQAAFRAKAATEGLPRLGLHVFMGERMKQYQVNSGRSMQDGRLTLVEALVRKR